MSLRMSREFKTTNNSTLHRRLNRLVIAQLTGKCDICRPHNGCNWRRRYKNWKHHGRLHQYRVRG